MNGYGTFTETTQSNLNVKRALLVTPTRLGQADELRSAINDAYAMKRFLEKQGYEIVWLKDFTAVRSKIEKFVYENFDEYNKETRTDPYWVKQKEQVFNIVDDFENHIFPHGSNGGLYKAISEKKSIRQGNEAKYYCSRDNIQSYMKELARKTKKGDNVFFYYSGHGGRLFNTNIIDAPNEDSKWSLWGDSVTDTFIHDKFVARLPEGSNAILMFDACHSGRMANLRYRALEDGRHQYFMHPKKRTWPKANVISISGSDDNEESSQGKRGGQLTRAFLDVVGFRKEIEGKYGGMRHRETVYETEYLENVYKKLTIGNLLTKVRELVKYYSEVARSPITQTPQIECSYPHHLQTHTFGELFLGTANAGEYKALNLKPLTLRLDRLEKGTITHDAKGTITTIREDDSQ